MLGIIPTKNCFLEIWMIVTKKKCNFAIIFKFSLKHRTSLLLNFQIHRYLIKEIHNWFLNVISVTELSLKLNFVFTFRIFHYEHANADIYVMTH